MKQILRITLIATVCMLGFAAAFAQTPKFGHINSAQLLSMMPEIKDADKKLQDFGSTLETQLRTMTNEYQTKVQAYQSQQASMADPIKDAKVKEITDLENRIQEFQQTAQESVSKKKEEMYSPILKKAEDAIVALAKEKGYAYIFDTSAGSVIYAQDSDDVMDLVKKKLNITGTTPPPASGTGSAPAPKK